jgi:hypothetical protein
MKPKKLKPKKKLKSLLPRRTWKINPYTKVKASDKLYVRRKVKKPLADESS